MTIEQAIVNLDHARVSFLGTAAQHKALEESILLVAHKCGVKPTASKDKLKEEDSSDCQIGQ